MYRQAKGTFDILPKDPQPDGAWRESWVWQHVEEVARQMAARYGFSEIRTPLFESTDLFKRSVGDGTDIVTKEMYTFEDRAGRSLTLRPEGTASVMRAFIEKSLEQQGPLHKLFYLYPMFRYERQQKGRYRQHHQFGVEAIGNGSPFQDAEVIEMLYRFYEALGLRHLTLHINSLGERAERARYVEAFKGYLAPHLAELSQESQERFVTNPMRILDSKNAQDRKILQEAPTLDQFISSACKEHFAQVLSLLDEMGIEYVLSLSLVRGLDYYNKTVFEITAGELGAQNALGGGGRYDGLIKQLGGPDLPAIGFGTGLERIIQTCLAQDVTFERPALCQLFMIPLDEKAASLCFSLVSKMRLSGGCVQMDMSGKKLKGAMRYADAIGARYIVVVGETELANKVFELKEMETGNVEKLSFEALEKRFG